MGVFKRGVGYDVHPPLDYLLCMQLLSPQNYVSSNLSDASVWDTSVAGWMRNAAKKDKTIDPLHDCPDHIVSALFWTILLVENLLLWPITLVMLVWWQTIDKQDFSDFRG